MRLITGLYGMALYKYFKPCRKATFNTPLPDPEGPLSEEMDTETIKELNKEVAALVNSGTMGKRFSYLKVMAEQEATIRKYAAEHGIINAIRHFVAEFRHLRKAQSTGGRRRTWQNYNHNEGLTKTSQLRSYQLKDRPSFNAW